MRIERVFHVVIVQEADRSRCVGVREVSKRVLKTEKRQTAFWRLEEAAIEFAADLEENGHTTSRGRDRLRHAAEWYSGVHRKHGRPRKPRRTT